jgi:hypothetical protein
MPHVDLRLNGDGCWPELLAEGEAGRIIHIRDPDLGIALLKGGMRSGLPSVMFRVPLPDGRTVMFETSLALLENSVKAMVIAADR